MLSDQTILQDIVSAIESHQFPRITELSLADSIAQLVTTHGYGVVSDGVSLWVYNPNLGYWEDLTPAQLNLIVKSVEGAEGPRGELRMSYSKAENLSKALLSHPKLFQDGFFDQAPRGVVTKSQFIKLTPEGYEKCPHSKEWRQRRGLDFECAESYGPELIEFFKSLFLYDEDWEDKIKCIQEFMGASLVGSGTDYATCLVLLGDGANGKSSLLDGWEQIMPKGSVVSSSPSRWGAEHLVDVLDGAWLNVVPELSKDSVFVSDRFKAIIAGDIVFGRAKYSCGKNFRPRATHVFSTNTLPPTADFTAGFWRRFVVIPMRRNFLKEGVALPYKDVQVLFTDFRPELLQFVLEGAMRLSRQQGYTRPESSVSTLRDWREELDSLGSWWDACVAPLPLPGPKPAIQWWRENAVDSKQIYLNYANWCEQRGRPAETAQRLVMFIRGKQLPCHKFNTGRVYAVQLLPQDTVTLDNLTIL